MSALPATTLGDAARSDQAIVLRPDRKSAAVVREAFRGIYGKAKVARARLAEWHGTLKASHPDSVEYDEAGKIVGYSYSAKLPWGPTVAEYFGPRRRMPAMPREVAQSKIKHVEQHQAASIIVRTLFDEIAPRRPGESQFSPRNCADLAARHGELAATHGIKLTPNVLRRIAKCVLTGKGHIDGRVNSGRKPEEFDERILNAIKDDYFSAGGISIRSSWKIGVKLARELEVRAPGLRWTQKWIATAWTKSDRDYRKLPYNQWRSAYLPHLVRDIASMLPLDEAQLDGTRLNVAIRVDGPDGPKLVFPWLIVLIDTRTRRVLGWTLGTGEDWAAVLRCVRPAFQRFGLPRQLYKDSGSGFGAALGPSRFRVCPEQASTFCARLGVELKHSIPGEPRGRGVGERFFRTVNQLFEVREESYGGNNPEARPDGFDERWKKYPESFPTLDEVAKRFAAWVDDYECTPHSGDGMNNRSPRDVWNELIGQVSVRSVHPDELAFAAGRFIKRSVRRDGIHINGSVYGGTQPEVLQLARETVWCRIDPNDPSSIVLCRGDQGAVLRDRVTNEPMVATNARLRGMTQDDVKAVQKLKSKVTRAARDRTRASNVTYIGTAEAARNHAHDRRGQVTNVSASDAAPSEVKPGGVVKRLDPTGDSAAAMRKVREHAQPSVAARATGTDNATADRLPSMFDLQLPIDDGGTDAAETLSILDIDLGGAE